MVRSRVYCRITFKLTNTMYNKHNLAVAKLAAKTTIKPALASVAFCGNKTVATDSFRLVEVSTCDEEEATVPVLVPAAKVSRLKLKKDAFVDLSDFGDRVDDKFPEYAPIVEAAEKRECVTVRVNAVLLYETLKLLADVGGNTPWVTMSVPIEKGQHPIILKVGNAKSKQTAKALVMPLLSNK